MKKIVLLIFLSIAAFSCKKDNGPAPSDKGNITIVSLPNNNINTIVVDATGVKWFGTDKGLCSFDDTTWTIQDGAKVSKKKIHDIALENTAYGKEIWLATDSGVNVVSTNIDAITGATTYLPHSSNVTSDTVFAVAVNNNHIRWFGTNKGVFAFQGSNWFDQQLVDPYDLDGFFTINKITSLASVASDTCYFGTNGSFIGRFYKEDGLDAVTGASLYQQPWSGIPSSNIQCVYIDGNNQWYGTEYGLTKHIGIQSKGNQYWISYGNGLVNKSVQCITKDQSGNFWIGTKGGVSVFDGTNFTKSYALADGLPSNNIQAIAIDIDQSVWVGTDSGIGHLKNNTWTIYKTK
jgi:ligand-binding sensor domain-containing protein